MLNSFALLSIRNSSRRWLKDTCTIERDTETLDELGSPIPGREIVAENVPCRMITSGRRGDSAAEIIGSAESLKEIYKIAIPSSVDLDINYFVTVKTITYSVVRLETALSDEVFTQAIITRHR